MIAPLVEINMDKLIRNQTGVGLIEVLITVLIIGTSLLAMSVLQARSLQQTHSAVLSTQANLLAYDILDRVRMASELPPAALKKPDPDELNELAQSVLPNGTAALNCEANRICTVTVAWSELTSDVSRESEAVTTYTYSSRM